jgi:hypothetical protein
MAKFVLKERGSYVEHCAICGAVRNTLIKVEGSHYQDVAEDTGLVNLAEPVICADCILQMHAILKVESEDYGTI